MQPTAAGALESSLRRSRTSADSASTSPHPPAGVRPMNFSRKTGVFASAWWSRTCGLPACSTIGSSEGEMSSPACGASSSTRSRRGRCQSLYQPCDLNGRSSGSVSSLTNSVPRFRTKARIRSVPTVLSSFDPSRTKRTTKCTDSTAYWGSKPENSASRSACESLLSGACAGTDLATGK
jgi:hypothetical protein